MKVKGATPTFGLKALPTLSEGPKATAAHFGGDRTAAASFIKGAASFGREVAGYFEEEHDQSMARNAVTSFRKTVDEQTAGHYQRRGMDAEDTPKLVEQTVEKARREIEKNLNRNQRKIFAEAAGGVGNQHRARSAMHLDNERKAFRIATLEGQNVQLLAEYAQDFATGTPEGRAAAQAKLSIAMQNTQQLHRDQPYEVQSEMIREMQLAFYRQRIEAQSRPQRIADLKSPEVRAMLGDQAQGLFTLNVREDAAEQFKAEQDRRQASLLTFAGRNDAYQMMIGNLTDWYGPEKVRPEIEAMPDGPEKDALLAALPPPVASDSALASPAFPETSGEAAPAEGDAAAADGQDAPAGGIAVAAALSDDSQAKETSSPAAGEDAPEVPAAGAPEEAVPAQPFDEERIRTEARLEHERHGLPALIQNALNAHRRKQAMTGVEMLDYEADVARQVREKNGDITATEAYAAMSPQERYLRAKAFGRKAAAGQEPDRLYYLELAEKDPAELARVMKDGKAAMDVAERLGMDSWELADIRSRLAGQAGLEDPAGKKGGMAKAVNEHLFIIRDMVLSRYRDTDENLAKTNAELALREFSARLERIDDIDKADPDTLVRIRSEVLVDDYIRGNKLGPGIALTSLPEKEQELYLNGEIVSVPRDDGSGEEHWDVAIESADKRVPASIRDDMQAYPGAVLSRSMTEGYYVLAGKSVKRVYRPDGTLCERGTAKLRQGVTWNDAMNGMRGTGAR